MKILPSPTIPPQPVPKMTANEVTEERGDLAGPPEEAGSTPLKEKSSTTRGSVMLVTSAACHFMLDTDWTSHRTIPHSTAKWVSKNPSTWPSWPNRPSDMKVN